MGSPAASAAEHEGKDNKSTPRYVWTSRKKANHPTTRNKMMTVAGVVAEKLSQLANLVVDHDDPGLMYDEKD